MWAHEWKRMLPYHPVQLECMVMQAVRQERYSQIPWHKEKGKRKYRLWSAVVLASHRASPSLPVALKLPVFGRGCGVMKLADSVY